jgi:hypothetical protein
MIKPFIMGLFAFLPYLILAQTLITGVIEGNQTWTAAGSPYQVTDGILKYGSKLTLEAGTKVAFKNEFACAGAILSKGTEQQNVIMTGKLSLKSKKNVEFNYTELQNFYLETDADIEMNHVSAEESVIIGYNLLVKDSEFQGGKLESRAWINQFSMENCNLDGCEIAVSGKIIWKNNIFDRCNMQTGSESYRITGNTFKNAIVGLHIGGNSRGSNTLISNTFEDNKTHIEMYVVEGYEQNIRVENNIFGKATSAIQIKGFRKTSRDGRHLGDKVSVPFRNNYWDNRSATQLQTDIIDAEDDIKLVATIVTEPQLKEKPVMKVIDNQKDRITLPNVPPILKQLQDPVISPTIEWILKVGGIVLLGFFIQYLTQKI